MAVQEIHVKKTSNTQEQVSLTKKLRYKPAPDDKGFYIAHLVVIDAAPVITFIAGATGEPVGAVVGIASYTLQLVAGGNNIIV